MDLVDYKSIHSITMYIYAVSAALCAVKLVYDYFYTPDQAHIDAAHRAYASAREQYGVSKYTELAGLVIQQVEAEEERKVSQHSKELQHTIDQTVNMIARCKLKIAETGDLQFGTPEDLRTALQQAERVYGSKYYSLTA